MNINEIPKDIADAYRRFTIAGEKLQQAETDYKKCYAEVDTLCQKFKLDMCEVTQALDAYFNAGKKHIKITESINFDKLKTDNKYTWPKIPCKNIFGHDVPEYSFLSSINPPDADISEMNNIPQKNSGCWVKQNINIKDIVPTQKYITYQNLCDVEDDKGLYSDTGALLVENDGLYYVIEGHHRLSCEILNNATTITAYVYKKQIKESLIRNRILGFVGSKKDGVTSEELLEFFNTVQEDVAIGQSPDADWLEKNSRLINCVGEGKKKKYKLTNTGKKAHNYLSSTGGIQFHPDNITGNRGWCDGNANDSSMPQGSPTAAIT